LKDAPNERLQPIKALEELALGLQRGDRDPSSVSARNAIEEAISEIEGVMGKPDLDYIGDFLSAACAVIKAKADKLLPPEKDDTCEETEDTGESEESSLSDPEGEWSNEALLAHLMEYRVFQDAVEELARRDAAWRSVFPRGRPIDTKDELSLPSTEIGLSHLLSALKDILEDAPREEFSYVPQDELFLEKSMDHIRSCIREKTQVAFFELFPRPVIRSTVIGVFLALLELICLREVVVHQDRHFGEIVIAFVPGG
jgi:segregation and condensation protein A